MKVLLIFGLLLFMGCAKGAEPVSNLQQQRQAALDQIADRCRAPRTYWKLLDANTVTLTEPALASDVKGSCLIDELFKSKLPVSLGFIAEPPQVPQ